MAETPIAQVRCQVFVYDGANWSPRDSGVSTVAVYHNPNNNMYRVVGLDGQSGQVREIERAVDQREKKNQKKN
jgi:hypothetical protein